MGSLLGAGIVAGLGSVVGGALSSAVNSSTTKSVNNSQLADAERNRQFASDEAEKNRQFQSDEADESRQFQSEEWDRQFAAQNAEYDRRLADEREYNTPAAQAARLRQAGINSSVLAFGNGTSSDSTFAVPSSPGISTSTPSGSQATGSPVSGLHVPDLSGIGNIVSSVGSLLRDISASKLDDAQASRLSKLVSGEIEGQVLKNKGYELLNAWQSTQNDIQKATKDNTIAKAFQELVNIKADIFLKGTQSEYYGSNADYLAQEKLFTMAKKRLTDKEYDKLVFEVKNQEMLFNSTVKMMNAQTEDYRAGARLKNVSADLSDIEKNIQSKSAKDRLTAIVADARAQAAVAGNKELEAKVNQIENTIQFEIKSKHPKYSRLSTAIHELKTYIPALINSGR